MVAHTNGDDRQGGAARSALDDIRRIVQALRLSARTAEQEVGLSGAQLFVLQRLAAAPAVSLNELAARTMTHQSSVSVVVQRLVERGLVERRPAAEDRRRVEIALTRAGRSVLRAAPGAAQDRLIRALVRLPGSRLRRLAADLRALVRAMGGESGEPAMFFEEKPRKRRRRRDAGPSPEEQE